MSKRHDPYGNVSPYQSNQLLQHFLGSWLLIPVTVELLEICHAKLLQAQLLHMCAKLDTVISSEQILRDVRIAANQTMKVEVNWDCSESLN